MKQGNRRELSVQQKGTNLQWNIPREKQLWKKTI